MTTAPEGSRGCGARKPTSFSVQWEGQACAQATDTRHSPRWKMRCRRWAGCGQQARAQPLQGVRRPPWHAGQLCRDTPQPPPPWEQPRPQGAVGLGCGCEEHSTGNHGAPGPLLKPIKRPSQAGLRAVWEQRRVVDWPALCRPHREIAHGWTAGRRIDAFEQWLEKTLESPLDCKEVQPVHPKENQS